MPQTPQRSQQPPAQAPSVPPQNLDAEESVVGAMMLSPNAIETSSGLVSARDFYRESHGVIFQAAVEMFSRGDPVDAITLVAELENLGKLEEVGGRVRMHELAALVPATSNVAHYARIVRDAAVRRNLIRASQSIAQLALDPEGREIADVVDFAEQAVFDVAQARASSDFRLLGTLVRDSYDEVLALQEAGSEVTGVPSGIKDLDRLTTGFQPGDLIVIAARPSMGKSGLALGIAAHLAVQENKPVALFTLEMSSRQVTQRLMSMTARVESQRIRTGRVQGDDWQRLTDACGRLERAPLHIDDSSAPTMLELRAKTRRLKTKVPNLALVIVDYLQLMTSDAENRVQEISKISRALKVLARDLDVPVLALSQLSRAVEQRHDKRPILSDLRESGSIEQDSDLVIFIYRDEYYNPEELDQQGLAELHLAKQRNGPTGVVKASFVKRYAVFSDLALPGMGMGAPTS